MNQPDPAEIEAIAAEEMRDKWERYAARLNEGDGEGSFFGAAFIIAKSAVTDIPSLLAALALEKQRADTAQETSRLTDQQLDYMRDRLAAAEQVIEAAERFMDEPPSLELAAAFRAELANYHTAITEPGEPNGI